MLVPNELDQEVLKTDNQCKCSSTSLNNEQSSRIVPRDQLQLVLRVALNHMLNEWVGSFNSFVARERA